MLDTSIAPGPSHVKRLGKPKRFLRTFERVTGVTPYQYVLRARLREAATRCEAGTPLDRSGRGVHHVVVRRALALVLALVVTLWLPVRPPVSERKTSHPMTDRSAQTEWPSHATDFGPQMTPGTAGTSQARLGHDVLHSEISFHGTPDYSRSAPVPSSRLRIHSSPPLRAFPLLI